MPGIDLNLDLPTLADTLSTIITKVSTALAAIEDDLAGQVTAGVIDINAELSFNGQPLTNVGGVRLSGGESSVVGTLYMDGSDFWVMTADGAVKLTAAGQVNIAGSGGIGGDYGTGDELVSYDLASQEYRFKANSSDWADGVFDDVQLMGTGGGSVRLDVDAAITTARTFKFKTLNASGVSMLVYDASTSTLETSDTERATNVVNVTTLNASSHVTAMDYNHTNDHVRRLQHWTGIAVGGAASHAVTGGITKTVLSAGGTAYYLQAGLRKGDRLKIVHLRLQRPVVTQPITVAVYKIAHAGTVTLHEGGFTFAGAAATAGNLTCTITSPSALADYEDYMIVITAGNNSDEIHGISVLHDHPA